MGALPKRRISSMRQGKRRAAIELTLPNLIPCPNCGQLKASHVVCPKCGFYKGKEAIKIKVKKEKKEKPTRP